MMQLPTELVSDLGTYQLKSILGNDKGNVIYCAKNSNGSTVVLIETDKVLPVKAKTRLDDTYKDRFYDKDHTKTFTVYGQDYLDIEGNDYFAYSTDEDHSLKSRDSNESHHENEQCNHHTQEKEEQLDAESQHICFNGSAEMKPCNNILARMKCKLGLRTPMMKVVPPARDEEDNEDDEDDEDDDEDEDEDEDQDETIEESDDNDNNADDSVSDLPDIILPQTTVPKAIEKPTSILDKSTHLRASICISDNVRLAPCGKKWIVSLPRTPIPKVFPVSDVEAGSEDDEDEDEDEEEDVSRSGTEDTADDRSQLTFDNNSKFSRKILQDNNEAEGSDDDDVDAHVDHDTSFRNRKGDISESAEDINLVSAGVFLSEIPHKKPKESNFQLQHVDRIVDESVCNHDNPIFLENIRRNSVNNTKMHPLELNSDHVRHRSKSLNNNCGMDFNLCLDSSKMLTRRKTKVSLERLT